MVGCGLDGGGGRWHRVGEPMSRGTPVDVQQDLAVEQGATTTGRCCRTAEICECWGQITSSASFKFLFVLQWTD